MITVDGRKLRESESIEVRSTHPGSFEDVWLVERSEAGRLTKEQRLDDGVLIVLVGGERIVVGSGRGPFA